MIQRREGKDWRRRSAAAILIVLIVVMTIAVSLFGLWARQIVHEQHQTEMQSYRLQAVRLAESGVHRLLSTRPAEKTAYSEAWSIPADQLDKRHAALVRLQVLPAADGNSTKYVATAEYPAESIRRAVVTRSMFIPDTTSTDTP